MCGPGACASDLAHVLEAIVAEALECSTSRKGEPGMAWGRDSVLKKRSRHIVFPLPTGPKR